MNHDNEQTITSTSGILPIRKKNASTWKADWLLPAGLIALSFIPIVAGAVRLTELASGGAITPANARFFAMPLPVIIHIIAASIFCVLGAFQFAPGIRRRHPKWHRSAGRVLIPSGIAAALSGLWMTHFYPLAPNLQGEILYLFRIFIGSYMVVALVLGLATILRRDITQHRAWILRGYAIAQGAGTQAVVSIFWMLLFGTPNELVRDLLLIAGWLINLAVAEWIIRRGTSKRQFPKRAPVEKFPVSSR